MPRRLFTCSPTEPYHITARSNNKETFPLPIESMWEIMSDYLHLMHHGHGAKIHAFVLMRNHFHLIASFPEANLSEAMRHFMTETCRSMNILSGRINHGYGGRSFRSRIEQYHHFCNVYKYVYRNPIEAGICMNAQDYPYSTLSRILGGSGRLGFPVVEDTLIFDQIPLDETLKWINVKPHPEHHTAIRNALKRSVFKLAMVNKKPHDLEFRLY